MNQAFVDRPVVDRLLAERREQAARERLFRHRGAGSAGAHEPGPRRLAGRWLVALGEAIDPGRRDDPCAGSGRAAHAGTR